jgi:hypothetical protein
MLKLREIWALRTRSRWPGSQGTRLFNASASSGAAIWCSCRCSTRWRSPTRASVVQQKTGESSSPTRPGSVAAWVKASLTSGNYLFPSRQHESLHLSVRQYARIVKRWVALIGGNPQEYGTHSLRRTKATLIYRRTKNLRAVQLLLGHRKLESTVRYLGIEVDDALEMAERTEC